MDRQEMLYKLDEFSRFETFLGDHHVSGRRAAAFCIDAKTSVDFSVQIPADIMRPSHDFLWNTDNMSLAYISNRQYDRRPHKNIKGGKHGIALVKTPRFLDLVDFCIDFVSIVYVLKGQRKMMIEGDSLLLEEGNAIILAPFTQFSSLFLDTNNITIQAFIRKDTFLRYFNSLFMGYDKLSVFLGNSVFFNQGTKYLFINSQLDERLRALVLDMLIEQEKKRTYSDKIIINGVALFLCQLISDYDSSIILNKGEIESARTADSIINYMHENISDISIDALVRRFSFSKSHIYGLLKQNTGKNYIQLLTEMKLEKAKVLLAASDLSIEDISTIAGYNSSRQFRRAFKEAFGASPGEFRRKHIFNQ